MNKLLSVFSKLFGVSFKLLNFSGLQSLISDPTGFRPFFLKNYSVTVKLFYQKCCKNSSKITTIVLWKKIK